MSDIYEAGRASGLERGLEDAEKLKLDVGFFSRTRIGNWEYLTVGLKESMEAAKTLVNKLFFMARPFKVKGILLASPEVVWMNEEITMLTDAFLREHSISEDGVLAAAVQCDSSSGLRAVEAVRAALRRLSWLGAPRYGAVIEMRCPSSIQEFEIRRMAGVMEDFLGSGKKLNFSFKLDDAATSLTTTLINVGLSLKGVEEGLDLNLFQLEPEAGREQKLFLDLPIPTIPE
ncbi:MAG: hypothetical protein QW172_02995 [Candidatus Bathyarchaeia archaeon]